MSLLYWGTRTGHSIPGVARVEQKDYLPGPTSNTLHTVAQEIISFLCHQGTYLAYAQGGVHQDPQVFSAKLLLPLSGPSIH